MAHGPARVLVDFDAERAGGPPGTAIARVPSVATVRLVADGQGRALEVSGRQAPPGLAGVRVALYDAKRGYGGAGCSSAV
jgi:hypothetical protein